MTDQEFKVLHALYTNAPPPRGAWVQTAVDSLRAQGLIKFYVEIGGLGLSVEGERAFARAACQQGGSKSLRELT